jgi:hypothetical protein
MLRFIGLFALLIHLAAPALSLQEPTAVGDFAKPMDPARRPSPYPPGVMGEFTPGFFLRAHGEERFQFHEWKSERTLSGVLARLPKGDIQQTGTAEVRMAPGRYVIQQQIEIAGVDHLTITGDESAQFVFADGPDTATFLAAPAAEGDLVLRVEQPEALREGFHYQIYEANGRGDRLLEFTVLAIKDELVYLTRPVAYMGHVDGIAAGTQIMEQVNFFRVTRCNYLTLQGLHCDGRHRGGTRTHTTYCGVFFTGHYVAGKRATTRGLIVRNCSFRNLKGRGVVFYAAEDVLIEGNYFEHIRAQAIEIDHYASGHIRCNVVNGADVGVMVNDAYESIIEANVLRHCFDGVRFHEVFQDDWVNTGNIVRDNHIGPCGRAGVHFFNEGMVDNVVEGNLFEGFASELHVVGGEGNIIRMRD